jgi:hypothetical protein
VTRETSASADLSESGARSPCSKATIARLRAASILSAVLVELPDVLLVVDPRLAAVLSFPDPVDCCVRFPALFPPALDVLGLHRLISGCCWLVVPRLELVADGVADCVLPEAGFASALALDITGMLILMVLASYCFNMM